MKAPRREARQARLRETPVPAPPRQELWIWAVGLAVALYAVFQAYAPVLNGPFLFDDEYLPFRIPHFTENWRGWITGVRPLLMLSYWLNFRISGEHTLPYHVVNILFHAVNGFLTFWIVRRFLTMASETGWRRDLLAGFSGALFLFHPVQTEAVAYVASRSENLSVMMLLAAVTVFLYRTRPEVSWRVTAAVLLLFGAAMASKEHTFVLPFLLMLTDYYWNPGFSFQGLRRNWRLYSLVLAGASAALVKVWDVFIHGGGAGFSIKEFTWYQYFFTQCRALFVYLRLFLFPVGQTADYDYPISRTLFEHGAIFGLFALVALSAAAWFYRRRYPLASYGWFAYLLLMAPTSSIIPIADPVAERRLYLSMLALLLIAVEFLRRIRAGRRTLTAALAGVVLLAAILTYNRNHVWSDSIALWQDTVKKSPRKPRPRFQLAFAYYEAGRCADAVSNYAVVARLKPPTYDLLVDWGLALDCLNQPDAALEKLRQAATIENSAHVYSLIGMVQAKHARWSGALESLAIGEKIDPNYAMIHLYRGHAHRAQKQYRLAAEDYRRALALDSTLQAARDGLAALESQMRLAP